VIAFFYWRRGHALVLLEMLIDQEGNLLGYVPPIPEANKNLFSDLLWLKNVPDILQIDK